MLVILLFASERALLCLITHTRAREQADEQLTSQRKHTHSRKKLPFTESFNCLIDACRAMQMMARQSISAGSGPTDAG